MAGPDIDPALARQVQDALDAVTEGLRQAKADAAAQRARASSDRDALARQLFDFADQGRALADRWDAIAERRGQRQAGA